MSIAVCALIHPSRRLRACLFGHALLGVVAALAIVAGAFGAVRAPALLAVATLAAAAVCARAALRPTKPQQLDISGRGQVRLTVQHGMAPEAGPVRLLPGSTLWPSLLLLLLRDEASRLRVVPVLRDNVAPEDFRALAVACRAIAARATVLEDVTKIV